MLRACRRCWGSRGRETQVASNDDGRRSDAGSGGTESQTADASEQRADRQLLPRDRNDLFNQAQHLNSSLSLSQGGLQFIADHEGFRPTVYPDQAGNDTIGYGHRLTDGESYPDGITRDEAEQLLAADVSQAVSAVQRSVTVPLSQSQFDALVSFTYNVGGGAFARSTLLKLLNGGDFEGAANQFLRWNRITENGASVVSQGLTNRRIDERNLFLGGGTQ